MFTNFAKAPNFWSKFSLFKEILGSRRLLWENLSAVFDYQPGLQLSLLSLSLPIAQNTLLAIQNGLW